MQSINVTTHSRFAARAVRLALASAALSALASGAGATTYVWSSGNFVTGGTAPSPLLAPDVLQISSPSNKIFNSTVFTNQSGTVDWQDGSIFFTSGTVVTNQSLWTISGDNSLINNGGVQSSFINSGIFRKTAGLGITTIGSIAFVNSGQIDVQSGIIDFGGNVATFNAGTSFTGSGTARVSGNATFNGAFSSENLDFIGGTFTGNDAALTGSTDWFSGTFSGSWTINTGSTFNAVSASNKLMNVGTITNNGTIAWQDGTLFLTSGSQLINNGLVDFSSNSSLINNGGAVSTITNNASGVFNVAAGQTVTINNTFVNNGGTINADGIFSFTGNNATFNGGTVFSGTGTTAINSNAAFNGAFSSTNLDLNAGTFTGTAAALTGSADWASGTISGDWTVNAGSTINALSAANKLMNAGTITNNGTIAWQGGALFLTSGSQLINNGLVDFSSNSSLINNGGSVSTITNAASGTIHVGSGFAVSDNNRFVNDGGTLTIDGTLSFTGNNAIFNAGTVFNGAGTVAINSNAAFNGAFSSTNLDLNVGTFTGTAAILNGAADLSGGTVSGSWAVASGSTLNVLGAGNKLLVGGSVTNNGTVNWQDGTLFLTSAWQITNNGLMEVTGNNSVINNGGAASAFVNNGTIAKTGGGGTTTIGDNIGFDNNGTISVTSGTIALPSNFTNDGTLTGTGTYSLTGTLTNNGTIAPGANGAGTVSLTGNYLQTASGVLASQIASTNLADLFNISGTAQLGGTLALSCIGGCSVQAGDSFTLLDSVGSLSGVFANVVTNGFLNGFSYALNYDYNADRVVLTVLDAGMTPGGGAVPEPASWVMMIFGFGMVAAARRRRRANFLTTATS